MFKNVIKYKNLIIGGSLLAFCGSAGFYAGNSAKNSQVNVSNNSITSSIVSSNISDKSVSGIVDSSSGSSLSSAKSASFSSTQNRESITNKTPSKVGNISKINTDLKLVSENNPSGTPTVTEYYKGGQIKSGKYSGYDRILMVVSSTYNDKKTSFVEVFATKDNKSFVVQSQQYSQINERIQNPSKDKYENYFVYNFDKVKEAAEDIGTSLASSIKIDNNYSLTKFFSNEFVQDKKNMEFRSSTNGINIYSKKIDFENKESQPTYQQNYFVEDEYGVIENYQLVLSKSLNAFLAAKPQSTIDYEKYEKENKIYSDKRYEITSKIFECGEKTYIADICANKTNNLTKSIIEPIAPKNIDQPGLRFSVKDTTLDNSKISTKIYDSLNPATCGMNSNESITTLVKSSDLQSVGKLNGSIELFTIPKDRQFQLAQYTTKFGGITKEAVDRYNEMMSGNPVQSKAPALDDYIAKNKVLFAKNPFGDIMVFGEYDYIMAGGCGKPVVYLYPKSDTNINVKLGSEITTTVDIPKHNPNTGWNVKANPEGVLSNLDNSEDCSVFDSKNFGQEYAKSSCISNQYPYLYWAGNTTKKYPNPKSGFVVSRDDLESTLRSKLEYIGLNNTEIKDMLEYWVPTLKSTNSKFYRFSILQNNELDSLFPMTISPKPDSMIRVFLDWDGVDSKIEFPQQQLIKYSRKGYVAVEWGGQKK